MRCFIYTLTLSVQIASIVYGRLRRNWHQIVANSMIKCQQRLNIFGNVKSFQQCVIRQFTWISIGFENKSKLDLKNKCSYECSLNFYHCKRFIGTQTTRISWSAHRIKCVTIALHISKMKIVFCKHLIEGSECKIGRQYQVVLLFVGLHVCMCVCIWNAPWNFTTTATKMLSNINNE